MEVTIHVNGQAVSVEVSIEVYEYLDAAERRKENLAHEQRRHWDARVFDEYIVFTEGITPCSQSPEQIYLHKAYYSLDCDDGIEKAIIDEPEASPEEIYLEKEAKELFHLTLERLNEAISHLTPIQARRIHKRYLLGMKIREIAEQEGVSYRVVFETIQDALTKMRKYFDKRKWRLHEE